MQIKAVIHEKYKETEIHVCHHQMNAEIDSLMKDLDNFVNKGLCGIAPNGDKIMLTAKDICRFFASDAKVFAQTENAQYVIPMKLYEIEKELDETIFLRISKSEIINLKMIRQVDMSIMGTIRVCLRGNIDTYTSRRNVSRLKRALGL